MSKINELRLLARHYVLEDKEIGEFVKGHILEFIEESTEYELKKYLLDGTISDKTFTESSKLVLDKRFKYSGLQEELDLLENTRFDEFINEDLGLSVLAAVVATPIVAKIAQQFKKCIRKCQKLKSPKGSDKDYFVCKYNCEIKGLEEKIKTLKSVDCSKKKDPDKCKEKVKKQIEKTNDKLSKTKDKLKEVKGQ